MSVRIRLKRMGSKKRPFYRIVVADSRRTVSGRIIEAIGTYDPVAVPKKVELDEELAMKWMHEGAQPSGTVKSLFSDRGLMEKFHNEKLANKK